MREKYESLSLAVLKDLAKARGMKGVSTLRKPQLIEAMLAQDEADAAKDSEPAASDAAGSPADGQPAISPDKEALLFATRTNHSGNADKHLGRERQSERRNVEKSRNEETLQAPPSEPDAQKQEKPREQEPAQENRPIRRSFRSQIREQTPQGNHGPNRVPQTERPRTETAHASRSMPAELQYDDAYVAYGILEILTEGYGFLRSDNYMPGDNDVYVSPSQIRRFNLKTGDIVRGSARKNNPNDRYGALLYIQEVNGYDPEAAARRKSFEDLTPVFPNERIRLERPGCSVAMRVVDMVSPVGKGQRGMIVSQPKAGKTTLLKEIARSVIANHPEIHLIILLIDERPEEVTDMRESIESDDVEVIYSTFDETPEHHKRVSEMVVERARRLVEHGQDVMILLDSITRMARAYNLTVAPSGRTLSGGLDPAALHMPKRFFGAARSMREGGSLTILATALVETGSKMDDVVFEEFKGTGNMELVLDRKMSERRIFPAIDINKSGTRRDDLLLSREERIATDIMHRGLNGRNKDEVTETILNIFAHTPDNEAVIRQIVRRKTL